MRANHVPKEACIHVRTQESSCPRQTDRINLDSIVQHYVQQTDKALRIGYAIVSIVHHQNTSRMYKDLRASLIPTVSLTTWGTVSSSRNMPQQPAACKRYDFIVYKRMDAFPIKCRAIWPQTTLQRGQASRASDFSFLSRCSSSSQAQEEFAYEDLILTSYPSEWMGRSHRSLERPMSHLALVAERVDVVVQGVRHSERVATLLPAAAGAVALAKKNISLRLQDCLQSQNSPVEGGAAAIAPDGARAVTGTVQIPSMFVSA